MERRANLARQALEDGDVAGAYRIAAQNFGSEGPDYADAEWVAGFIALTRLDDPKRAVGHFTRFQAAVATPISLGRAGYWLGRAFEESGDAAAAESAFRMGAEYQTSFYGQLAAEKLGAARRRRGSPAAGRRRTGATRPSRQSSVVKAAYFLHLADDDRRASQFFRHAAEGQPPETRAALAQMAIDLGRPQIGIRIAKDAAAEGIILADQYYPLHAVAEEELAGADRVHDGDRAAGIRARRARRRERRGARADAAHAGDGEAHGRRGGGRLQRGAARHRPALQRAARHRLPRAACSTATTASYVLATAAYNAGPGRVDQWLEANGDPRKGGVDSVEWIEVDPLHRDPQLRDAGARVAARLPRPAEGRGGAGADRRRHQRRDRVRRVPADQLHRGGTGCPRVHA